MAIVVSEERSLSSSPASFSAWEYQVIALAGVTQSAVLVHDLATRGIVQETDAAATINSLLVLNPASVADIYPNVSHLHLGLSSLQSILSNERSRTYVEIVRYMLGILVLRSRLMSNPAMQAKLRDGLQLVEPINLQRHANLDHSAMASADLSVERTFEQLARLYQDTISTLSYRIQVQGKIEHLKNDQVTLRIRALLLAGIRAAVLWYQLGGRRWRVLFHRKRIQGTTAIIRRKLIVPM